MLRSIGVAVVLVASPPGLFAQTAGQDSILVGLEQVEVLVGVTLDADISTASDSRQLEERLHAAIVSALERAGIRVKANAESRLVLALAGAPVTVGTEVQGVAVSSILQLTESGIPGRTVSESIDALPGVQASGQAWRAAYWDLARDRGIWDMPVWSGPLGVAVYPIGAYQADVETEVNHLVRRFIEAHSRYN